MKKHTIFFVKILFFTCLLNCSSSGTKQELLEISLEEKAVTFFLESMYENESLFSFSEDAIILPPGGLIAIYFEEGLFHNLKLYSSYVVDHVSPLFFDMFRVLARSTEITGEKVSEEDLIFLRSLEKDYEEKRSSFKNFELSLSSDFELNRMSFDDFLRDQPDSAVYMKVGKAICSSDNCYVDLSFYISEELEMEEAYEFYIVFDKKGDILNWFSR